MLNVVDLHSLAPYSTYCMISYGHREDRNGKKASMLSFIKSIEHGGCDICAMSFNDRIGSTFGIFEDIRHVQEKK